LTPNTKSAEYVHLCSEDLGKTWSVRQVSTSNEVYIVQALSTGKQDGADGDTEMGDAKEHSAVLAAIAKADSILELLPATTDIEARLRDLLPVYNQEQLTSLFERCSEMPLHNGQEGHTQFSSQIPAPEVLIKKVWQQLCISRCPSSQEDYFIPTARLLESAWNSALATFNIRARGQDVMERADFEDGKDHTDDLLSVKIAIWHLLSSGDGTVLKTTETATWVIRTLWQSMWEIPTPEHGQTVSRSELEATWRTALPRFYAAEASVDKLEAGTYEPYEQHGEEMIRWTGQPKFAPVAQPEASKPGKRKWHEKFRDSRNMKT
jgi:hypothetical protein